MTEKTDLFSKHSNLSMMGVISKHSPRLKHQQSVTAAGFVVAAAMCCGAGSRGVELAADNTLPAWLQAAAAAGAVLCVASSRTASINSCQPGDPV